MVSGDDDRRVLIEPGGPQRVQHIRNQGVDERHVVQVRRGARYLELAVNAIINSRGVRYRGMKKDEGEGRIPEQLQTVLKNKFTTVDSFASRPLIIRRAEI